MSTAAEYFGLFLTALRNQGVEIPCSDKAVAEILEDVLEQAGAGPFGGFYAHDSADSLRIALTLMILDNAFVSDNGFDLGDDLPENKLEED